MSGIRFPVVLSLVLLINGCAGDSEPGHAVRGTVRFDGQPLKSGVVNFFRGVERPRGCTIAADGTYNCSLPSGDYQVAVIRGVEVPEGFQEGDPLPPQVPLPPRYADPKKSDLQLRVDQAVTYDVDLEP